MQTLFEAANHIAQEIERTRQHLLNLEQALEGLKPLITVDAATTTVTYTLASQAQPVEDLSVVNATVKTKRKPKSKPTKEAKPEETKAAKTKVPKAKAVDTKVATEPLKLPATGAELWLKCLGRKKVTVAQLAEAALKKLKLDDSAREVITTRAKAWAYIATKKGDLVVAGTRDGSKLYQLASVNVESQGQTVQVAEPAELMETVELAPAPEVSVAA
jgi:phage protein D